jgi:ketosteroid isomerase-like protein
LSLAELMIRSTVIESLVLVMTGVVVFVTGALARKQGIVSPLKSLVATEQAFSQAAADKGTREAFVQFIAEDGIIFRPKAVNGKRWMQDHPLPPPHTSEKRALLAWQPIFADVAEAGDLGYTTGPWEFKDDIKDERPSGYGDFVTLWKKQADSSWKFVLDLGISHPQSSGALPQSSGALKLWQITDDVGKRLTRPSKSIDLKRARQNLVKQDLEFSDAALNVSFLKAFQTYAAAEVRLFRENSNPFIGKQAAILALSNRNELLAWQATGEDVSRSGDLGYTYGTYTANSDDATKKLIERGNYLRIWKKQNGVWKVVLDVANPLPPE